MLDHIAGVISAVMTEGNLKDRFFTGVSIDSRTVSKDNLFLAIEGKNTDGHKFIPEAIAQGAIAVVVNDKYKHELSDLAPRFLVVKDTLKALHDLASWWISKFDLIKIAVTGTNGKTTTKEMIAAVLSTRYKTYKSPGNYNNFYGVPLAIFEMDDSYEAAVFEFGMSTPGEIAGLTKIVKPQYGLITNVEAAHLETMLTVDAIAHAKFELFDNMPDDGTAIFNLDNKYLHNRFAAERLKKFGFSIRNRSGLSPSRFELNGSGCAIFELEGIGEVHLAVQGMHNMYNAVAAAAVGRLLSIPDGKIKNALESFRPIEMRMETFTVNGVLIINDTYNANPISMKFALDTLASLKVNGRKFAVLGDMLELGEKTTELHRDVGAHAATESPDFLITCGNLAREIIDGAMAAGYSSDRLHYFEDTNDVIDYLLDNLRPDDAVLVKASRSMAFDRITVGLRSQLGRGN